MFSVKKVANVLSLFKWKRPGESSLDARLLSGVLPEIELSEYQGLHSSGSESPSGLLNDEGLKVEPIADLDIFFERLYHYYCEKGLWCIIIKWIVELLSLGFIICFSAFFLLFVDWTGLRNAKCGINAVESGSKPCDLATEALHQHPLTPFTLSKGIIVGYLGMFSIYWLFCFLRFFVQLKDTLEMRHFYRNTLQILDHEVQATPWASILEKVVQVQRFQQLCVVKDLSEHDVVMRIMRKENYLIGMFNKGVLAFPISQWVPGIGPAVNSGRNGRKNRLVLTKTLERTLNWCIFQGMFDRNFFIQRNFSSNPSLLKKRLMAVGLAMFLLTPFLVIFMLVHLFLRHAEQLYNHPSMASSRRWSNLSKWMFREHNEVDHLFKHRMNRSVPHAANYLKQFPSPIVSVIAKFVSFVSGGFAAILIIIAFLEESLLEGQIFGRYLFWYAAVFGTVTAISRAAIADELQVLDPEGAMSLVVQHTHYMPKRWRGKENTNTTREEFETLFQYTGMMLLEEMASLFLTPYLLLFGLPERVDDILQFISDFTVDIEGVGHVCSLSVFDFERHGNSNYGSPYNVGRTQRSSQGKMEKSFLSFQSSYPTWEPSSQGKQFLSNLDNFTEQMLQVRVRETYPHPMSHQVPPNLRGQNDTYSFISRDAFHNNMGGVPLTGYQLGSPWFIDREQRNCPYLLDWYYTSHSQTPHGPIVSTDVPTPHAEVADEPARDLWMPCNYTNTGERPRFEENWGFSSEIRQHSQYEASTSNSILCENVFQHDSSSNLLHPTDNHWWVRSNPHSAGPQTSFLEPPVYGHDSSENIYARSDRRSRDEQEASLDWRRNSNMSTTYYMDGDEPDGDFRLPFSDIYHKPLKNFITMPESE